MSNVVSNDAENVIDLFRAKKAEGNKSDAEEKDENKLGYDFDEAIRRNRERADRVNRERDSHNKNLVAKETKKKKR